MEPTHPSATAAPGPRMPRLLGGRLCLDFVNTVDPRHGPRWREYLNSYADLVAWGVHAGAVTADEAVRLAREAAARPDAARAALHRAIDVREVLYRLFLAVATGASAEPADLSTLNEAYGAAMARARVIADGRRFVWGWASDRQGLDRVLWPVVRCAAELLTAEELRRVKACGEREGCGWLFLDTSKNSSRRWCSMEVCGTQAKLRRYRARRRSGEGT